MSDHRTRSGARLRTHHRGFTFRIAQTTDADYLQPRCQSCERPIHDDRLDGQGGGEWVGGGVGGVSPLRPSRLLVVTMDVCKQIANEYSYAVLLKRQSELNGPDVAKVQAPAEKPSRFVRDERLHSGVRSDKALR